MAKKLYVGNLSYNTHEEDLREAFSKFGEVVSATLIVDQSSGRSKGFGFVEMASDEDAQKAISSLNGTTFMDRSITVNEARPKTEAFGFGRQRWRPRRLWRWRRRVLEIKVFSRDIEKALRNLKKKLQVDGLFGELKKRRFYEKPSVKKKTKQLEAEKRRRKLLKRSRASGSGPRP